MFNEDEWNLAMFTDQDNPDLAHLANNQLACEKLDHRDPIDSTIGSNSQIAYLLMEHSSWGVQNPLEVQGSRVIKDAWCPFPELIARFIHKFDHYNLAINSVQLGIIDYHDLDHQIKCMKKA